MYTSYALCIYVGDMPKPILEHALAATIELHEVLKLSYLVIAMPVGNSRTHPRLTPVLVFHEQKDQVSIL